MGLSLQELVPGMKVSSWVGLHLHLDIHCLILSKVSSTAVMKSLLRDLEMLRCSSGHS